jgi:exopolyphosphatase/guanosine-5'-triphosphate,3'-diphosphate pyrophosphatase
MTGNKYGAIDIGSNAVRLMVANVLKKNGKTSVKRLALIRVPIRLGDDVFTEGYISERNYERMIDAMIAFKHLMKVHDVTEYRAMATSAMRNADNGHKLIAKIRKTSGVNIEIIDGKKEAAIIFSTKLSDLIKKDRSYIYVDVGGGSTEITVISKGKIIGSKSFRVGTVRILNGKVDKDYWSKIEKWIKEKTKGLDKIEAIGSGGNINKIFKMSGKSEGDTLSYSFLFAKLNFLKSYTFEERVEELRLNEDRADVIIPATEIYMSAMEWAGAKKMHVPKIGLVDGIIRGIHKGSI